MTTNPSPEVPLRRYSDVVYVFEPNRRQLPPVRTYLAELWERRAFMRELARANIRGSRARTVLGELWGILDPLFQAALYWFLISVIRGSAGIQNADRRLALMVGCIFLYGFMSAGMGEGATSILRAKGLMLNSTFPRALLPLSAIYKAFIEFLPCIGIYLVFHAVLGMPFGAGLLMLPLFFAIGAVLNVGTSLIFATLTVFFRDMQKLLNYVSRILFFATPVIYQPDMLGDGLRSLMRVVNPYFALFESFQIMLSGGTPPVSALVLATAWAAATLVAGYWIFVSNERSFALHL